jgi:hypothetical protein
MITCSNINIRNKAEVVGDCSLGNRLFRIAGVIGIATKNGYSFGFPKWIHQEYFINRLPFCGEQFKKVKIKPNYNGYDYGFFGFNYRDHCDIDGEFGSWRYSEHCEDLIRHYFELKPICEPFRDRIIIHYRAYKGYSGWYKLGKDYYSEALKLFPKKKVIVVTDDIEEAHSVLGSSYEYTSNTPIIDFYLMANADYLVMANSSFSAWAAWIGQMDAVAPNNWYSGVQINAPKEELYYKTWKRI